LRRLSGCQAELDPPAEEQLVAMPWRRQTSATQTPGFSVSCTVHFLVAAEATGGSTAGPLLAISSDTYTAQLAAALNRTRALG
jgi:hypothetical protein